MSYLDRVRQRFSENAPQEKPTKPTKPPQSVPNRGFVGFDGAPGGRISEKSLPADILRGVQRLGRMQPVGRVPRDVWRTYAADALWLADSGVAAEAIDQGWTPLDLFGISADEQWQCLAAWIGGRRDEFNRACILLREMRGDQTRLYATQSLTGKRRWHYPDPAPADARLPWTMT